MKTPLLNLCACGPHTSASGHCIVHDPVADHWTLIVWPVVPGTQTVHGVTGVTHCPKCGQPVGLKFLEADRIPKEAQDHLRQIHAASTPDPSSPLVLDLPEPKEV